MARKVSITYVDDLTGAEGDVRTVLFALDGRDYEIDLNEENHDRIVKILAPYMVAGRRIAKGKAGSSNSRKPAPKEPDSSEIRKWAKEQGYEVNDRGRVPASIREAYSKR
ncbi:histone-like nucleoid-structuring protein Lsr2 [Streptomyces sp. NRRL F-5053]|uniref:histone-like nucleoid-structuring protein Lsr2 n=1 Tax=Streptomyces sp. NRRL F-5053 TaxID=1463854 RepID=UPI00099DF1B0|nr:Lsr2 family protein [Streptomyces sp. NRRL F-5053]